MAQLQNTTINDTGFLELPQGTTAQRPASPQAGMIRYNTDIRDTEFYDGNDWRTISDAHPEATGGQIVETDIAGKTYRIHYFTDTGNTNFTVNKGGEVEYLIVGGGGGGGSSPNNNNDGCGGGGGGGVLRGFTTVTPQTYTITVGAGGSGVNSSLTPGGDGGNSNAFGLTAIGGGGGATQNTPGRAGGSGGGAGNGGGSGPYPGGAGTSGQGFPGGIITTGADNWVGSGGGGAGGPGISGDQGTQSQGFGGRGIGSMITGKLEHFGGGGGGGCAGGRLGGGGGTSHTSPYTAPRGGIGGGATGGYERNKAPSGEKNTGGGGGGGTGNTSAWGGDGGSGIVIVRYEKNSQDATSFNRKQLSVQPKITTIHQNNIVMNLDAGDLRSYPGSGNTWFDLSSRGNNGTRVNNPTWYDAHGGFFRFNGSNQYIDLVSQDDAQSAMPSSYIPMTGAGTNNFSIEVWFRTSQVSGSNLYTAPHLVGRDNGDIYANLTVVNGRFTWVYYNGAWQGTQSTTNVSNGRWYHAVWANNSNNGDLFINGVKEVSLGQANTVGGNFFSPDSIARGYSGANGYFEGDIAVVRFYSKRLDEGEVRQNFNALRGRFGV